MNTSYLIVSSSLLCITCSWQFIRYNLNFSLTPETPECKTILQIVGLKLYYQTVECIISLTVGFLPENVYGCMDTRSMLR